MNAAEFVAELERRGKWEVWLEFYSCLATVTDVRPAGFLFKSDVAGAGAHPFTSFGKDWRFPEKPRPDFLTWMKERKRFLGVRCQLTGQGSPEHERYLGVKFAIADYESGRDP